MWIPMTPSIEIPRIYSMAARRGLSMNDAARSVGQPEFYPDVSRQRQRAAFNGRTA